jgi:hypothetical protein
VSQFGPTFDACQRRYDNELPDEGNECECIGQVSPLDETWEVIEAQENDGIEIPVHCRCRSCGRKEWLSLAVATVDTRCAELAPMVTQCCVCKQYRGADGRWFAPGLQAVGWISKHRDVSHGYCPVCFNAQMASAREFCKDGGAA